MSNTNTDTRPIAYNMRSAAAQIGVSYSTIRRLIADGTIRASRVGNLVMVSSAELERFLEAHAS